MVINVTASMELQNDMTIHKYIETTRALVIDSLTFGFFFHEMEILVDVMAKR